MLNGTVLTSVVVALATTITTQSFAHDRGPGATPYPASDCVVLRATMDVTRLLSH
jgi:hypothetical protein